MRNQKSIQNRTMMTRTIIDKQANPPPTLQQLLQKTHKRSLILFLRKAENKRTLTSSPKNVRAFIFAIDNCNRVTAPSRPALLNYGQKPKGGFILTANYPAS
jgi:hypothetical protein